MRKVLNCLIILVFVCGMVVLVMAGDGPNQPKAERPVRYWQDVLRKPTQRWINEFGNDEILVAYNLQALINAVNNQSRAIVALKDKVLELEEQVQELKEEAMVVTETTPDYQSQVSGVIDSKEPNEVN